MFIICFSYALIGTLRSIQGDNKLITGRYEIDIQLY